MILRRWSAAILALAILTSLAGSRPVYALDPHKLISQYTYDYWTPREGLPHLWVTDIHQTRDGYLWIGLSIGLARFDGIKFTLFEKTTTPGLAGNNILELMEARDGTLWIGTLGGGVACWRNGRFTSYTTIDGLPNNEVWSLTEANDGAIWAGTSAGVACWKGGVWNRLGARDGLSDGKIDRVLAAPDGSIWINGEMGLKRWKNGALASFSPQTDGLHAGSQGFFWSREGDLWIPTEEGFARFRNGSFERFPAPPGMASTSATICEDRHGNFWQAAWGVGLLRFHEGRYSAFTGAQGLHDNRMSGLCIDREGSLWFGTMGGGLGRLKDGTITSFTVTEGLANTTPGQVFVEQSGAVWADNYRLQDGKSVQRSEWSGVLAQGRDGTLWTSTTDGVVLHIQGNRVERLPKVQLARVQAIHVDRRGQVWIASDEGLSCWANDQLTTFTERDGPPSRKILTMVDDPAGNLWVATRHHGVACFCDGRWKLYSTANGLSNDAIEALHADAEGTIWVGTNGGGLNRIQSGQVTVYTRLQGLFDDVAFTILEDDAKTLWMGSERGIYSVRKADLAALDAGRLRTIPCEGFGLADGMKSISVSGHTHHAGCRGPDGRLWFATLNGLCVVDPRRRVSNEVPPPVFVEQVLIDQQARDPQFAVTAAPGAGDLVFRYTALSLRDSARVQFRYQLLGFDSDWIDAGTRREAFYTHVPPGEYRFRVIACNNDGVWNTEGTEFAFRLQPHFYQTWQCKLLLLASLALLALAGYRVRIWRLRANERALAWQVEVRTRALQLEILERKKAEDEARQANRAKSEFLANMSHEIRTPMNGILGMTELALDSHLTPEQREYLSTVKSSAEALLTILNDILDFSKIEAGKLVLDPAPFDLREFIGDTLKPFAARAHAKGLEVAWDVSAEVPASVLGDSGRLRQVILNLVGNAIKFTDRGEISLFVSRATDSADSHLHFAVRDTGIGVPPEKQTAIFEAFEQADTSTTRKYGGTGLGLAISSRLVNLLGGRIWLASIPGKGSTFQFTASLPAVADGSPTASSASVEPLREVPILVAEGNATNRRTLQQLLEAWGACPTVLATGAEALAAVTAGKAAANPYRLAILDGMMAGLDGFALATEIHAHPEFQPIGLVVLTSALHSSEAARCRAERHACLVSKPVKPSDLLAGILAALHSSPGTNDATLLEQPAAPAVERPQTPIAPNGLRILLAEDNSVNQRLAVRILQKRGHSVIVAENGRQALLLLQEQTVDLMLMDVQMPEMDGIETTQAIRAQERETGFHLPIIAMTAHAMQGDRERCLAAGMDGYITKPIQARDLAEAIAQVMTPRAIPAAV